MAKLIHLLLLAKPVELFHRINIHSALLPNKIIQLLQPIFTMAEVIKEAYDNQLRKKTQTILRRAPYVTVN